MTKAEKVWTNLEQFGNPRQQLRDTKQREAQGRKAQRATMKRLGLKVVETGVLRRPRLVVEVKNARRAMGKFQ